MENQLLSSFGSLMKSSWDLYVSNWKKITFLFLPLEIVILISLFVLDIIPQTTSVGLIILILCFTAIAFLGRSFSKLLAIDSPLFIHAIHKNEHTPLLGVWYRNLLKKIIPLAYILLSVFMLNFAYITLLGLIGAGTFVLSAISFKGLDVSSPILIFSLAITLLVGYLIVRSIIKFIVSGMFSPYVYVFEERRGLDAVATSFTLTRGKQFKLFWRLLGIWFISIIPFVILVWPINGKILFDNMESIYTQIFILGVEPVIPETSLILALLRNFFTSVATLFSLGFVAVAHYFLWKNLKETAIPFDGEEYTKTRKFIKRGVGTGVFLFVLIFITSLFFGFFSIPR